MTPRHHHRPLALLATHLQDAVIHFPGGVVVVVGLLPVAVREFECHGASVPRSGSAGGELSDPVVSRSSECANDIVALPHTAIRQQASDLEVTFLRGSSWWRNDG